MHINGKERNQISAEISAAIKSTWVNLETAKRSSFPIKTLNNDERKRGWPSCFKTVWKNAWAMKTSWWFVRTSTRIINHRSNAHFGRWMWQMWFKINIKNPFPLRNHILSHILSAAEVMAPGIYACMRERKKQICIRENTCKMIPDFMRYRHFLIRCRNWILKSKWLSFFFTDTNIFHHLQSP